MSTKQTPKPQNIVEAINQVMTEVKNVEKNTTVGAGRNAYKGVSDKDVKEVLQPAMARAGLAIIPANIEHKTDIERWTENTQYGEKQKQQVFTEVKVTYKLVHSSGESLELQGIGHGIDPQDKAPGKACTYSLKMTLMYLFLVPSGHIDDTDTEHSDDKPVPGKTPPGKPKQKKELNDDEFTQALDMISEGKYTAEKLTANYILTKDQIQKLAKHEK